MTRLRGPREPACEAAPRREPAPPVAAHHLLALQRTAGNQAVTRMLARTRAAPPGFNLANLDNTARVQLLQEYRAHHDDDSDSGSVGQRWDDHIQAEHGRASNAVMTIGLDKCRFTRSSQTCIEAIQYALDHPTRITLDPKGNPRVGHVYCADVGKNQIGDDPVHPPTSAHRILRGVTVVFDFARLRVVTAYPS